LKTSLFGVLQDRLPGARVLDLCAGVGGLGLEALSRGARRVTFVEQDAQAARDLRTFLETVGAQPEAEVRVGDALTATLPAGPFDLIFLDPPFALWFQEPPAERLARPLASLAPEGLLIAKIPARLEVPGDRRYRILRRTKVASTAYLLLARP